MDESVTLTGAWEKLLNALDPKKWNDRFEKKAHAGLVKLGFAGVKLAREAIRNKEYAENAPSTIAAWYERGSDAMMKRAKKRAKKEGMDLGSAMAAGKVPLVSWGDLLRSINHKVDGLTLYLGANKKVTWRGKTYNIAAVLHNGCVIKQPVMKRTIVIPARPFISQPLESEAFAKLFGETITESLKEAFRG